MEKSPSFSDLQIGALPSMQMLRCYLCSGRSHRGLPCAAHWGELGIRSCVKWHLSISLCWEASIAANDIVSMSWQLQWQYCFLQDHWTHRAIFKITSWIATPVLSTYYLVYSHQESLSHYVVSSTRINRSYPRDIRYLRATSSGYSTWHLAAMQALTRLVMEAVSQAGQRTIICPGAL